MSPDLLLAVAGILGALAVGIVSPGPSFVLVARVAVAVSRRDGLAASLGMGFGGALFGALAFAGLIAVLAQVPWLYAALKIAGGVYLLYIALQIWRGAAQPLGTDAAGVGSTRGVWRSFLLGLATQVSNPKTAVVYASVFAAFLPANMPLGVALLLLPVIFVLEAGWYALVAVIFSAGRPRAVYLRAKTWIDRTASAVMATLGIRLIVEAARG